GPAAQIERHHRQRFIHGEHKISSAVDSAAIAQRFRKQLPEHDPHIFDGMVLVDVEITLRLELQIESAMFGEQLEHVVEEADPGRDFVSAAAFNAEPPANLRLFGIALDGRRSHAFNTVSNWLMSSSTAMASCCLSTRTRSS